MNRLTLLESLKFLPGVITALSKIAKETDYELVMVTNQDGLGTDSFPEETFWPAHNKMLQILKGEGVEFAEIFIDRTFPEDKCPDKKTGNSNADKISRRWSRPCFFFCYRRQEHRSSVRKESWVQGDLYKQQ